MEEKSYDHKLSKLNDDLECTYENMYEEYTYRNIYEHRVYSDWSTIAAYLGTITETLSRTLRKSQNENITRVSGKKIFVINMHRLK